MSFAAIYVPNFALQAIVRCEPELHAQPTAVIEGQPPTYRVTAFNRLAEKLGVTRGMTKASAEQFQEVRIRHRSAPEEETAHRALLDAAWSISSLVENTAPDTLLLDLSGLARLFGTQEEIARRTVARTSESGMNVHVAVSANVETARILARALSGPTVVPEGQESRFLETLPVGMLSLSQELADILERWGVTTCKSFASLPVLSLSERVGQEGVRLHAIASGKGNRPLLVTDPVHHFEEWFELEDPVDNLEPLSFLLGRLIQQLCTRIAARVLAIRAVHVNLQLQRAFESSAQPSREFFNAKSPLPTYSYTLKLPIPTVDHTLLLKLLRLRLQSNPPGAPVQKIHMFAESDRARTTQGGLFVPASPDPQNLELTIARIASVVGENNVGSPQLLDTHRPDSFHMQKFSIASVTAPAQEPKTEVRPGFRFFRPPVPASVQLEGKRPRRVAFQGMLGKVLHASGPWRISGDWWEAQAAWQEEAWDLELHFPSESTPRQGSYRVSYDGRERKWYVRGVYD
jgi:protein ImuB